MILHSRRLPEGMGINSRQQQHTKTPRSGPGAACSLQQGSPLHLRRLQRTIACVQHQGHAHEQQHEHPVVAPELQQQCGSSATPTAVPLLVHTQMQQQSSSSSSGGKALAAALHAKWQQLGGWCRQHRVPQLMWGGDASSAVAALSLVSPAVLPGGGFSDLFTNRVFLAGFWAWFTAQTLKIFTRYLKKGVWDIRAIVDSGGMPSSHSALCAGITTAIAFQHGMGSSAFALAVALSSIVMYDAAGVRRHAGKQAEVLNQVIGELLEGHPVSDVKLKEVLGHTPLQVGCGCVLGVLFGIFFPVPDAQLVMHA